MHSSKEQQDQQYDANDSLFGMALGQLFTASVLGPYGAIADMAWESAEMASAIYTERFEARADNKAQDRTNGHEGGFQLGAKNSLGPRFGNAHSPAAPVIAGNDNGLDFNARLPYWKRDAFPAPRRAA